MKDELKQETFGRDPRLYHAVIKVDVSIERAFRRAFKCGFLYQRDANNIRMTFASSNSGSGGTGSEVGKGG